MVLPTAPAKKHLLNSFCRCYVEDDSSCRDARPSSYGAPWSWSCQACRSRSKEEKEGEYTNTTYWTGQIGVYFHLLPQN